MKYLYPDDDDETISVPTPRDTEIREKNLKNAITHINDAIKEEEKLLTMYGGKKSKKSISRDKSRKVKKQKRKKTRRGRK